MVFSFIKIIYASFRDIALLVFAHIVLSSFSEINFGVNHGVNNLRDNKKRP
jgi:hypothetical protein